MSGLRVSQKNMNLLTNTLQFRNLSDGILTLSNSGIVKKESMPNFQIVTVNNQTYLSNTNISGVLTCSTVNVLASINSFRAYIIILNSTTANILNELRASTLVMRNYNDISNALIECELIAPSTSIIILDVSSSSIITLDSSSASIILLDVSGVQMIHLDALNVYGTKIIDISAASIQYVDISYSSIHRNIDLLSSAVNILTTLHTFIENNLDIYSAYIYNLTNLNTTIKNYIDISAATILQLEVFNAIAEHQVDISSSSIKYLNISSALINYVDISSATIGNVDITNANIENNLDSSDVHVSTTNISMNLIAKNATIENVSATNANFPPQIFNSFLNGINVQLTPYSLVPTIPVTIPLTNPSSPGLYCILIDNNVPIPYSANGVLTDYTAKIPISAMGFFDGAHWSLGGETVKTFSTRIYPSQINPIGSFLNADLFSATISQVISGNILMIPICVGA